MLNDLRQNKYVIIDASHGGNDNGLTSNNIKEKDLTLDISRYIYDKLKNAGINVSLTRDNDTTITDTDRNKKILNTYGNNQDVILISNHVDSQEDNIEIVYALRNNSNLSNLIASNLTNIGLKVKEPYQRRLENDTAKDFYSIHRNTGNIQTVLVNYGNTGNYNELATDYRKYANAVADAIISYLGGTTPSSSNQYIVTPGDTLYSIARRFNTTVDELKKLNNLSSNILTIGQKLIIKNNTPNTTNTYIVKSGDNLYSIAKKYNTTVENIKKLNNLNSNLLSIGQVLKIPNANETNQNNENNETNNEYTTYTVKKGDNLYNIANKYNTTVSVIMKLNNLTSNLLSIGQTLKIPNTEKTTYIVKSGDTLYNIAKKYNTTVETIKKLNNLNNNILSIGQKLII